MNIALRAFKLDDAANVARLAGDAAVAKWASDIPFPYSRQDAIDWIMRTTFNPSKMPFAVELDGRLVACVSYWPHDTGGVEVGYWVGRNFWGKGICTRALKLLMASEHIPAGTDVFARIMANNMGSKRVLEKCGFAFLKIGTIFKEGREIEAKYYVRSAAVHRV
jgi:RimJ/RimL family protein N-acetyltransferase